MVAPTRVDITLTECFCILRGLHSKGITAYGPYENLQDAMMYAHVDFQEDTWEVLPMIKEE